MNVDLKPEEIMLIMGGLTRLQEGPELSVDERETLGIISFKLGLAMGEHLKGQSS